MFTNIRTFIAMIVFAGGPHTTRRITLAKQLIQTCHPPIIILTGAEFRYDYSNLTADITAITSPSATNHSSGTPLIITDNCTTTWSSCHHISSILKRKAPHGGALLVVTSNYHAPRVRWLLTGLLGYSSAKNKEIAGCFRDKSSTGQLENISISIATSPDIPWRESFATPVNRKLILGEAASWIYCFPLGLYHRYKAVIITLCCSTIAIAIWLRRRHHL